MNDLFATMRVALLLVAVNPLCWAQEGEGIPPNVRWVCDQRLEQTLTIPAGSTLHVEPGVAVRCGAGVSVVVEGTLIARGTAQEPIVFSASDPMAKAGAWEGLVIAPKDGKQAASKLAHCRIDRAVRGVAIRGSAKSAHRIEHCTITQHREFGIYAQDVEGLEVLSNEVSHFGVLEDQEKSAGIALLGCKGGRVEANQVSDGNERGIWLEGSEGILVKGNDVFLIAGDKMKLRGYGIHLSGSDRNEIIANKVHKIEYIDILLANSARNVVQDNHCGPAAADGIALNGDGSVRNRILSNRIESTQWSQIYTSSGAHDNLFRDLHVTGGGWGASSNCAGGNRFEQCVFDGTYPLNIWGYGGVTFVGCTLKNISAEWDYWVDVTDNAKATFIDCELDPTKIRLSYKNAKLGYFHALYTLTVRVVDAETGRPITGAKIQITPQPVVKRDNGPPLDRTEAMTDADGLARVVLTHQVLDAQGQMVAPKRSLHVTMEGYAGSTVEGVETSKAHQITVCLRRQRQDGAGP